MILTVKQAVGDFIVFKLLKMCWIIKFNASINQIVLLKVWLINLVIHAIIKFLRNCVIKFTHFVMRKLFYSKNILKQNSYLCISVIVKH